MLTVMLATDELWSSENIYGEMIDLQERALQYKCIKDHENSKALTTCILVGSTNMSLDQLYMSLYGQNYL